MRLEPVLRRPRWVNIAFYLLRNLRSRHTISLNTHRQSKGKPVGDSVDYVQRAYAELLRKSGLEPARLEGARILELGPGDNFGLALRLLGAGASQVIALDRFAIRRDPEVETAIYNSLLERLEPPERARCEAAVDLSGSVPRFDAARLEVIQGVGVEEAPERLGERAFDAIFSIAVLEHVTDLDAAFEAMDRLLRPGGYLLHQVDFRDHRMFTAGGGHPLEFLTVSHRVWRWMTADSGGPNRRLVDYYRSRLDQLGYESRLLVDMALGVDGDVEPRDALRESLPVTDAQRELIAAIRPRLQSPYRGLPDGDLAAAGAFIAARKPEAREGS